MPAISVSRLVFFEQQYSLMQAVLAYWSQGQWALFILVLVFSVLIPASKVLIGLWAMVVSLFEANGAHSRLGKELRGKFSEAGFVDIESAGTFESFASNADTPAFKNMMFDYVLAPAMADSAISHGLPTQEEVN